MSKRGLQRLSDIKHHQTEQINSSTHSWFSQPQCVYNCVFANYFNSNFDGKCFNIKKVVISLIVVTIATFHFFLLFVLVIWLMNLNIVFTWRQNIVIGLMCTFVCHTLQIIFNLLTCAQCTNIHEFSTVFAF